MAEASNSILSRDTVVSNMAVNSKGTANNNTAVNSMGMTNMEVSNTMADNHNTVNNSITNSKDTEDPHLSRVTVNIKAATHLSKATAVLPSTSRVNTTRAARATHPSSTATRSKAIPSRARRATGA